MAPTSAELRLAYRHILTHAYRAVKFSKPARYILLHRIRHSFRTRPSTAYDPRKVARTVEFLRGAALSNGVEHRLLRNLVHYWWQEMPWRKTPLLHGGMREVREWGRKDVEEIMMGLERSMDIYVL